MRRLLFLGALTTTLTLCACVSDDVERIDPRDVLHALEVGVEAPRGAGVARFAFTVGSAGLSAVGGGTVAAAPNAVRRPITLPADMVEALRSALGAYEYVRALLAGRAPAPRPSCAATAA